MVEVVKRKTIRLNKPDTPAVPTKAEKPKVKSRARRALNNFKARSMSTISSLNPFSSFTTFFEAASHSPRLKKAHASGPNSANGEIETLRAKSRSFFVNDPIYRNACRQVANNCVGYGIKPNIKDKNLRKLWNKFQKEIDARGRSDFYGLQHRLGISVPRDGEALFRFRPRRPGDLKSGIDFQIQALEADHLPLEETKLLANGNIVISGVERSPIEKNIAYWLLDYHPKDFNYLGVGQALPKRVPASEVLHIYLSDREGDARGYPWGAAAFTTAERYRAYDDNELERKVLSAARSGYFKKPRLAGDEEDAFDGEDEDELDFQIAEAGEWAQMPEGWEVQETTPMPTDSNYAAYKREQHAALAASFGFAVEMITMNWEKLASDRQYRALMLEVVRWIESIQHHMIVFQFCQKVWERFVASAYANELWKPSEGKTIDDYIDVDWITPKRGYIHPVQDITAVSLAIEKGLESRKRAVSATGYDVEDIDEDNVEDINRAKEMKLPYGMFGLDEKSSGLFSQADMFGAAVRAGLITPQIEDEIHARKEAGLLPLSKLALAHWDKNDGVKRPLTIKPPDDTGGDNTEAVNMVENEDNEQ